MIEEQQGAVKDLSEYGDDSIAEMIDGFTRQAEHYRRLAFGARGELLARLLERGATVFDGKDWQGKVRPGQITHRVEDPIRFCERLEPFVQAKELQAAFVEPPPPPLRVDHTTINNLYKRGGDIAKIIDEERVSIRGDSTLELERKPEVKGEQT
jgi:hypothetical protein